MVEIERPVTSRCLVVNNPLFPVLRPRLFFALYEPTVLPTLVA